MKEHPAAKKAEKPGAVVEGVAGTEKDKWSEGFNVEVDAAKKTFTVESTYGEHTLKVKTLKSFKVAKAYTEEEWLTRIENGELTEVEL